MKYQANGFRGCLELLLSLRAGFPSEERKTVRKSRQSGGGL